jgi:hypothetical protein
MEKVLCKVTNKMVELLYQGFDIAIIKREDNDEQECVRVETLNVIKRTRPAKFKFN